MNCISCKNANICMYHIQLCSFIEAIPIFNDDPAQGAVRCDIGIAVAACCLEYEDEEDVT
jgi:hypothetical protein